MTWIRDVPSPSKIQLSKPGQLIEFSWRFSLYGAVRAFDLLFFRLPLPDQLIRQLRLESLLICLHRRSEEAFQTFVRGKRTLLRRQLVLAQRLILYVPRMETIIISAVTFVT